MNKLYPKGHQCDSERHKYEGQQWNKEKDAGLRFGEPRWKIPHVPMRQKVILKYENKKW